MSSCPRSLVPLGGRVCVGRAAFSGNSRLCSQLRLSLAQTPCPGHQPCLQFQSERLGGQERVFYSGMLSCRISPRLLPLTSPNYLDVFGHSSLASRLFCVQDPLVLRDDRFPYSPVTFQPERVLSVPSTRLPLNFSEIQETISWASDINLESRSLV